MVVSAMATTSAATPLSSLSNYCLPKHIKKKPMAVAVWGKVVVSIYNPIAVRWLRYCIRDSVKQSE